MNKSYLTKKVINKLYKIVNNYKSLYSDSGWETVTDLINDLKSCEGVNEVICYAGKYHNYLNQSDNTNLPYRTYKLEIETEFDTKIGGELTCSAAGTMDDPFSKYDICGSFWNAKDGLSEGKEHSNLIKTLGEYTKGNVSAKKANDAIMGLANSSNKKSKKTKYMSKPIMGCFSLSENKLKNMIKNIIKENYSSMNGMTSDSDIETFMRFISKNHDMYGYNSSNFSLDLFIDLLRKVSNAISEDRWKEIWHWVENLYTYVNRDDKKNAEFCYRRIVDMTTEALEDKEQFDDTIINENKLSNIIKHVIRENIDMNDEYQTESGLSYKKLDPSEIDRFDGYDKTVAQCQIMNCGYIIVDVEYGDPIDDEYELDEIYNQINNN